MDFFVPTAFQAVGLWNDFIIKFSFIKFSLIQFVMNNLSRFLHSLYISLYIDHIDHHNWNSYYYSAHNQHYIMRCCNIITNIIQNNETSYTHKFKIIVQLSTKQISLARDASSPLASPLKITFPQVDAARVGQTSPWRWTLGTCNYLELATVDVELQDREEMVTVRELANGGAKYRVSCPMALVRIIMSLALEETLDNLKRFIIRKGQTISCPQ